jgi:hypothetical protein
VIDPGDSVLCDYCNDDFTDSEETGGILVGSDAVCPHCQEKTLVRLKQYQEEQYIRGTCPENMSFANWVRAIRRGDVKETGEVTDPASADALLDNIYG